MNPLAKNCLHLLFSIIFSPLSLAEENIALINSDNAKDLGISISSYKSDRNSELTIKICGATIENKYMGSFFVSFPAGGSSKFSVAAPTEGDNIRYFYLFVPYEKISETTLKVSYFQGKSNQPTETYNVNLSDLLLNSSIFEHPACPL